MIDRELGDASDILVDAKTSPFKATGAVGAKSAVALSEHVEVKGWKPVPTELQVSDVPALARTLGGSALYSYKFAPLRELIQNAADAIDARVAIDPDFSIEEGRILLRVIQDKGTVILEVEDNGIGMSERTLTGPLLDFGFSFWRSEAARAEFPGLQTTFTSPRGRFGIGFFSVFMWADAVSVSTRLFREGTADARVLEFRSGLGRRPILRTPQAGETSNRFQTRVSLTMRTSAIEPLFKDTPHRERSVHIMMRSPQAYKAPTDWTDALTQISAALPISVFMEAKGASQLVNLPDWKTTSQDKFLMLMERLFGEFPPALKKFARAESAVESDGHIVGRAFLVPDLAASPVGLGVYDRGIFAGFAEHGDACGLIEGETDNAARDRLSAYDIGDNDQWFTTQIDYMFRIAQNAGEVLACQEVLLKFGRFNPGAILFAVDREFVSFITLIERVRALPSVTITLEQTYGEPAAWKFDAAQHLGVITGKHVPPSEIFALVNIPQTVKQDEDFSKYRASYDDTLGRIVHGIFAAMGERCRCEVSFASEHHSNRKEMVLEFIRS
jgi:hypothetical protein